MRNWRRSAAYRIAFANFAAYAIGIALLGAVVFAVIHIAFSRQLDAMVSDDAQTLAAEFRSGGLSEAGEAISKREAASNRMVYAVFTRDGRRIYGSLRAARPALGLHVIQFDDPIEGADLARSMTIDLSPDARLVVAADSDWLEQFEKIILIVFGAGFVGICLLGFAGAILLGGYLEQRLRTISDSAKAIIGGDIRQRMPVGPRRDEFDQVAIILNRMLDRIEGLLDNLRQVSSDIAHDLRTPLSRLRTRLEQGVLHNSAGGEADAVLEDALQRIDEVLSLFAAILRIAEVESGETRRYFERVDLSALVSQLAESFALSVEDGGRSLLWSIEPGVFVDGDRELLAQACINLLENAQRHTPPGTVIRLTSVAAGGFAYLAVIDSGGGVPKADLPRITKRFARLESSRHTAGYGLGLSLVDAVAKLHSGRLVLTNAAPGLSATMELPVARACLDRTDPTAEAADEKENTE
jgi:signal transduction histidine kinase